jgi:outer membrane protein OmpA-like peptidoglycan-associated protein
MHRFSFSSGAALLAIFALGYMAAPVSSGQSEDGGSGLFHIQSAVIPKGKTYSFGYYGRLQNVSGMGPFNSLLVNSEILDTAGEPFTTAHARLWALTHTFSAAYSHNERFETHIALPFYTQYLGYGGGYYTKSPFSVGDVRYGLKYLLPKYVPPYIPFPFTSAVLAGGSIPTSQGHTPVPTRTEQLPADPGAAPGISHADGTQRFGWHLGLAATADLMESTLPMLKLPTVVHVNLGYRKNGPLYSLEHDFYDVLAFGTGFETAPLSHFSRHFSPRLSAKGEYWHENRVGGVDREGIQSVDDISFGLEYKTPVGVSVLAGAAIGLGNRESSYVPFVDVNGNRSYNMNVRSSSDAQLILAVTYNGQIKDPDRDKDGVLDKVDRCPDEHQGPNGKYGCPLRDRDLDGVVDDADQCPDVHQGPLGVNGCPPPDIDHDSVCDAWVALAGLAEQFASECTGTDICPDVPGVLAESGCVPPPPPPPRAIEQKTLILKGVNFETGKSILLPSSFPVLNDLAAQLLEVPVVELEVSGHTDNRGAKKMNKKLSQARAEAVMNYLIQQGVAATRLSAAGYGPDRPVAPNTTPAGRAENRRVEFNRTDKVVE